MWSTAREIAAGDVVIVWLTREALQPLTITPGKEFNGRFGCYKHSDLIGVPYGSKVAARSGKGFIHVLRPTPELWTLALPHRTQILYLADIAFVTAWLGIKPGARVVEAGTGSGSFTHSVARTIGPQGRLFSFEFHQSRVDKAREEFAQHGMAEFVELQHRNVCKDGFALEDDVDAVFLDLPAPWDAIPHAKRAMRKDLTARICCFSPCVEQVLRTVSALNEHGFTDITMYETLLRPHDVSPATPAPVPVGMVRERLKAAELRKEVRRLEQIAASRVKKGEDAGEGGRELGEKRKRELDDQGEGVSEAKRARTLDDEHGGKQKHKLDDDKGKSRENSPAQVFLSQPIREVRGHTSYLTFACLLPTVLPPREAVPVPEPMVDVVAEPEQMTPELPDDDDDVVEALNANDIVDQAHARMVTSASPSP